MNLAATTRLALDCSAAGKAASTRDSVYAARRESVMSEPASLIMLQFLGWVADRPRTREQAVEAWHSCPHISVWEDAIVEGLVATENNGKRTIALTQRGRALLEQRPAN
jgi:hypothetical protein